MAIIWFGQVSIHLLYMILYPFTIYLQILFGRLQSNIGAIPLNVNTLAFQYGIGETAASIPYIYSLIFECMAKQKKEKLKTGTKEIIMPNEGFVQILNIPRKSIQYLIIISISIINTIVYYIFTSLSFYYGLIPDPENENQKVTSNLQFELFPLCFFANIVLNIFINQFSIRRHHVLSLILIFIGWAFFLFPNIIFEKNLEIKIPFCCLANFLLAIQFVGDKWLMDKKYYTAYGLLFAQGITTIIISLVFGTIMQFVKEPSIAFGTIESIMSNTGMYFTQGLRFVLFLCLLVVTSVSSLFNMLTRYHYSPFHCNVAIAFHTFVNWVIILIEKKAIKTYIALVAIGHAFAIVGILIFTEIIILYFWKFQNNTATEINKRSQDEYLKLITEMYITEIPFESEEEKEPNKKYRKRGKSHKTRKIEPKEQQMKKETVI